MNIIVTKAIGIIILTSSIAASKDLGFRFKDGKCLNDQQQIGLNPGFFGQCSDLRGVVLGRFNLDEIDFSGSDFTGADLQKSSLKKSTLEKVNFESANLAGVNFDGAKIKNSNFTKTNLKNSVLSDVAPEGCNFTKADFSGLDLTYFSPNKSNFLEAKLIKVDASGVDFSKTNLKQADFTAAKLSNANFTEAQGEQGTFKDATLTNANFTKANFSKSIFKKAELQNVQAAGADLTKSDLRFSNLSNIKIEESKIQAAVFNRKTILPISREKAEELGMVFANSGVVLIIWDAKNDALKQLQKALEAESIEVAYSKKIEYEFDGTELNGDFDSVIHLNGDTYTQAMPKSGQDAILKFVKNGGTFIHAELNGYETDNGGMSAMRDLSLFPWVGNSGTFSFSAAEGKSAHPLLEGIPKNVSINASLIAASKVRNFGNNPAVVVMKNNDVDAVAYRKLGKGTVVGFGFGCTYTNEGIPNCLADKTVQKLYVNAINFGLD
ncbi:MAG: hypothetical protein A4S09_08935 [Proteobacteria bacterium SG_bin7]|nr:MAG: hypothetical protein A4S09_08935 [Proteobacteria bacterium SG_bin7]